MQHWHFQAVRTLPIKQLRGSQRGPCRCEVYAVIYWAEFVLKWLPLLIIKTGEVQACCSCATIVAPSWSICDSLSRLIWLVSISLFVLTKQQFLFGFLVIADLQWES